MKFVELQTDGFGKFNNLNIRFKPGINIIFGRNEAGKSTLHTFLRAMLFGIDTRPGRSGKKALYESFEPWDNPENYRGSLTIEHEGKIYRIERDFSISPKDLKIIDLSNGSKISNPSEFLNEVLCGLTESGYINTISIGQLCAATDRNMSDEIKRYVANINTTGSSELNASAAIEYLEEQKAAINQSYQPDAVKAYTGTIGKIKNLEAQLNIPENENKILKFTGERDRIKDEIIQTEIRRDELQETIQRGRKTLAANNFTDVASIEAFGKEVREKYDRYVKISRKAEKKIWIYLPVIMVLCAMSLAGLSIYKSDRSGFIVFGSAGMVMLVLSIVIFAIGRRTMKSCIEQKKYLELIFASQLGNNTIDDSACNNLNERLKGFIKLCGAIDESEKEKSEIDEKMIKLSKMQNICQEDIEKQQRIRFMVEQNLLQLNALKNQAAELKSVIAENKRIKEKTDAIDIAIENLNSLSKNIRNSMGIYLNKEAGKLISGITGGAYESIDIDEKMSVYLNSRGRMISVDQVSSGTVDQVYLALRLSAVRLIEGEEDRLPLIFDDSFVLYDDERLKHAISFISSEYKGQILIFTCHHREENALFDEEKDFNFIKLKNNKKR